MGISIPIAIGSALFFPRSNSSFAAALRAALVEAGGLYLVGILAVGAIAGGPELWEIPLTLLLSGILASGLLMIIPLRLGQLLIRRVSAGDAETALRFTTAGWPIAMALVSVGFITPGGLAGGDLFSLSGPQVCAARFCGISLRLAVAVGLGLLVVLFGPGIIGLVLYASKKMRRQQAAYL